MNSEVVDPHLTTKIVSSYVRHHAVGASQLSDLITSIHRSLGQLGTQPRPEEVPTPAVTVRQSVRHEYVVCLDCGYRGKTLRRHINSQHGLNRDEYLKRWGLRSDHPLTAPAYSEQRSTLAKALGFGRKARAEVVEAATPVVAAAPVDAGAETQRAPSPRRRSRSRSRQADVVSAAVAAPPPVRRKRPRSRPASQ
jgi:MucR family transcriptional regulator, transcriptional regulator of exopolysaccharide biosynthesis